MTSNLDTEPSTKTFFIFKHILLSIPSLGSGANPDGIALAPLPPPPRFGELKSTFRMYLQIAISYVPVNLWEKNG